METINPWQCVSAARLFLWAAIPRGSRRTQRSVILSPSSSFLVESFSFLYQSHNDPAFDPGNVSDYLKYSRNIQPDIHSLF